MCRQEPIIFEGGLSGRWFVATSYRTLPNGGYEAQAKHDITDQIEAIIEHVRAEQFDGTSDG